MQNSTLEKLKDRYNELQVEKDDADKVNEERKAQVKVQTLASEKSLKAKLERDKGEEYKERQAELEIATQQNDDTSQKLVQEKEKYDTIKAERIALEHKLNHSRETLKIDDAFNKTTGADIKKLEDEIKKLEDALKKKGDEDEIERKSNTEESKKNRILAQKKSALTAKSSFIEENYDYCSNVKQMETGVFRKI